MNRVKKFFRRLRDGYMHAKQLKAADYQARYLITNNRDFRNVCHSDLVRAIMSDDPKSIDQISKGE